MADRKLGERLLYFALTPAIVVGILVLGVLAARTNLQIDQARQRTMLDATDTLVDERITKLDASIVRQDNTVASYVSVEDPMALQRRWAPLAARETPTVDSVVLVDLSRPMREVLAFASRAPSPRDDEVRRLLITRLLPTMNLSGAQLRHLHEVVDERQILLSYWQTTSEGRPVLIVVFHDVDRIVGQMMPQLFRDPDRGNARMNVVDERGQLVFGPPIKVGKLTVGKPFASTLTNWRLQVALTSAEDVEREVEKRRLFELSMVFVASFVAAAGLLILILASLKERRVSALKSDFVANVSHELKTPLALIRLFGELLLLERADSPEKKRQYLSIIVGESERLTALIENVLDFARLERGKASYDFEEADVRDVVQRAIDVYKHRAERESVELVPSVPDEPLSANVDKRALELAVMNLVDNALKYAREGGRVEIEAGTLESGDPFLSVTDFGPGIPPNERGRIFERFFRGATADSTRARGSGIGLSLVRHIAQAHGGRVRVFSPAHADGRGARFTLELGTRTRLRGAERTTVPPARAPSREPPEG